MTKADAKTLNVISVMQLAKGKIYLDLWSYTYSLSEAYFFKSKLHIHQLRHFVLKIASKVILGCS